MTDAERLALDEARQTPLLDLEEEERVEEAPGRTSSSAGYGTSRCPRLASELGYRKLARTTLAEDEGTECE